MSKITKQQRILDYLKENGTINYFEAEQLGTNRLSEYIRRLRDQGYIIETIMIKSKDKYGDPCRYGIYKLIKN